MIRTLGVIVLCTFLAVACTQKAAPTKSANSITNEKTGEQASEEKKDMSAEKTSTSTPTDQISPITPEKPSDEVSGKTVYTTKCARCHAAKAVNAYTFSQ